MFIKSLQIGLMGFFLCAANAWAGPASIQGIVKDAQGKPIKGADVRIESRDGKQLFNTTKTDTQGRYIDQATQLNFDLKPVAAGQASTEQKKKKHMVWMPPSTGSHTGGRWVEVPDGAAEPGTLNVKKASAEELQRESLGRGNPNTGN
jgi:hypothetical protein